jgi:hypothetical protein
MQFREGSFRGPRPTCPKDPKHRVHRHGTYERYQDCDNHRRLSVERFLCPRCGITLSVLPKNRLPYLALNTRVLQSDFDARASGTDPPEPCSEKERGCLRRAFKRLRRPSRSSMRFAWPNDSTHQTKCQRVLEGAKATGQPRRYSPVVGQKVQHLTFGRLPLPAAQILSGLFAQRGVGLDAGVDPTERYCLSRWELSGRLAGV